MVAGQQERRSERGGISSGRLKGTRGNEGNKLTSDARRTEGLDSGEGAVHVELEERQGG